MAGQTGNENVTVQNLKVVKVITEKNLIVLKGCVPGHKILIYRLKSNENKVLNIKGKSTGEKSNFLRIFLE